MWCLTTGVPAESINGELLETTANLFTAGAIYYLLGLAKRERQLLEEVEQTERRYSQLVESAPSPIIVLRDGEIVYTNPTADGFFAGAIEDVDDCSVVDFVHAEDRTTVQEGLDHVRDSGHPIAIEPHRYDIDGRVRHATATAAHITYESEDAVQIVLQNITEREEYQRQVETPFQSMYDAILVIDPDEDEILECNDTASELLGYDRETLLEMGPSDIHPHETVANADSGEINSHAETILSGASALHEATSHTRVLSDILETGRIRPEKIDIVDKLTAIVERIKANTPAVTVDMDLFEKQYVYAAPNLDAALDHLLRNAVEHNDRETPRVEVSVRPPTGDTNYVEVVIADNGPGIPEQERNVLLRGEEKPLEHGSGLGLWIVNWIVTHSGGQITFDLGSELRRERPPWQSCHAGRSTGPVTAWIPVGHVFGPARRSTPSPDPRRRTHPRPGRSFTVPEPTSRV